MHNAGTHGQDVAALAPGRNWAVHGTRGCSSGEGTLVLMVSLAEPKV